MHTEITLIAVFILGLLLPKSKAQALAYIATGSATGVLLLFWKIADKFTGEGINVAAIEHVRYGVIDGELGILRFPELIGLVVVLLAALGTWSWACLRLQARRETRTVAVTHHAASWTIPALALLLLPIHPAVADISRLSFSDAAHAKELDSRLQWELDQSLARANRPFVYIYMESFESTFLDEELFPGVTPRLRQLEREALRVSGIRTSPFMTWTTAGMIASQCGTPILHGGITSPVSEGLIPGRTCLGDLLNDAGYNLTFLGGADLSFAGKGRFYSNHGFHRVLGLDELRNMTPPKTPTSKWGYYDDTIFDQAKREYLALEGSSDLFALFLLTTTTHPESGFPSPTCRQIVNGRTFSNPMLDAVHCSDQQVFEFVRWLQSQNREDLIVILASDHLQVAGDANHLLARKENRENLYLAMGQGIAPGIFTRNATMVDVAPTTAHLVGFGVRKLGLGRNLLLEGKTLTEEFGLWNFNSALPAWISRRRDSAGAWVSGDSASSTRHSIQ